MPGAPGKPPGSPGESGWDSAAARIGAPLLQSRSRQPATIGCVGVTTTLTAQRPMGQEVATAGRDRATNAAYRGGRQAERRERVDFACQGENLMLSAARPCSGRPRSDAWLR